MFDIFPEILLIMIPIANEERKKGIPTMPENVTRQLRYTDIGYKGKPIDALSREELLEGFREITQLIYNCASSNNMCKAMITINRD